MYGYLYENTVDAMDYAKDIRIDESALDVEFLKQPTLLFEYGRRLAELDAELATHKGQLELLQAELDLRIRKNPARYKVDKITNEAVRAAILRHKDYQAKNTVILDLGFEKSIAQKAISALEAKKSALENLVKLHGQQYFAGPSIPRDLSEEWAARQRQKNTNKSISKKMRRINEE